MRLNNCLSKTPITQEAKLNLKQELLDFENKIVNDYSRSYVISTAGYALWSFGFSKEDLLQMTRNAINAAFVDDVTRARLLKKLDDYEDQQKKTVQAKTLLL